MRATIDFETTKVSGNMAMNSSYRAAMETPYSIVNNNDNGVNEIINIYQPVKSPSEVARAIKIQRKELAFG